MQRQTLHRTNRRPERISQRAAPGVIFRVSVWLTPPLRIRNRLRPSHIPAPPIPQAAVLPLAARSHDNHPNSQQTSASLATPAASANLYLQKRNDQIRDRSSHQITWQLKPTIAKRSGQEHLFRCLPSYAARLGFTSGRPDVISFFGTVCRTRDAGEDECSAIFGPQQRWTETPSARKDCKGWMVDVLQEEHKNEFR